jgi:hypothetical protein
LVDDERAWLPGRETIDLTAVAQVCLCTVA